MDRGLALISLPLAILLALTLSNSIRLYKIYSFAVTNVKNGDCPVYVGGFRFSHNLFSSRCSRSKILLLRLGETARMSSKPCIIKRHALFGFDRFDAQS